jgi:hypothetical protein
MDNIPLYKIIINIDNGVFEITPIKYYFIDSPGRRVVLYEIKYIDKDNTDNNLLTIIPYYISDGYTNHLRANMLYPFFCFNHEKSKQWCPYDETYTKLPEGGLMKINFVQNIIIEKIDSIIRNDIKRLFRTSNLIDFLPLLKILDRTNKEGLLGVTTVLPRITNILDFIISITTDAIIKLKESKYYRPVFVDRKNKYNMDVVDELQYQELYQTSYDKDEDFQKYLLITDIYRIKLVKILNYYIKQFQKVGIIEKLEKQILEPELISIYEYNEKIKLCNREQHHPETLISTLNEKLFVTYAKISEKLFYKLTKKINTEKNSFENSEKNRFFYDMLNKIILKKPVYNGNNFDELLTNNINNWNAKCYKQKYEKYKLKYLNLKKLI